MQPSTLIRKLLSPAGFGLVLILFLTPFLTVSCATPSVSSAPANSTFTGLDLVIGGRPDIDFPTITPDAEQQINDTLEEQGLLDVDVFALLAALVVMLGMASALIRDRLARHGAAAGLAALAGALLAATILRAPSRLADATRDAFRDSDIQVTTQLHARYGLWLTVIALSLLVAGNALALIRAWREPVPAPPRPELAEELE